ncbi:MAG: GntR family transcriptional regulator [Rectinemataceae bacterium]
MQSLDKGTHVPIYIQIKQIILDDIRSGKLKPDEQIPSEANLAQLYGVSRLTARSAVSLLVNEGRLVRFHGLGTFVKRPRIESSSSSVTDFIRDMRGKGYSVRTELLVGKMSIPPSFIQDTLNLPPEGEAFYLRRRRSVNNEVIVILESYIPSTHCPDLLSKDFEVRSLYEILQTDYALVLDQAQERLEAGIADDALARELFVEPGAPVLFSTRRSTLLDGSPFEFTNCWYRGDRYAFEVTLQIRQAPQ